MTIYGRVVTYYQDNEADGVGLILWGDLRVLTDSPEVDDGISGLVIYMFVDKKYPLTVTLIERMLDYQLEIGHGAVGNELTTAVQLVKFLKKQIADSKRAGVHDLFNKVKWNGLMMTYYCLMSTAQAVLDAQGYISVLDGAKMDYFNHNGAKTTAISLKLELKQCQITRAPRNKEGQFINQDNTKKQGNNEDTSLKEMLAIDGVGFDWSDMAEEQVMAASNIPVPAEENLGDPIDIRVDIIHPEPVAAVILLLRLDIAKAENASLRARIKTTEAIKKMTRNREKQARVKIEQQLELRLKSQRYFVKAEDKSKEKQLEEVPIVQDFPEVFPEDLPGISPTRQMEFQIDLIPGVAPVAREPYRLAPSEMKELSDQLKELSGQRRTRQELAGKLKLILELLKKEQLSWRLKLRQEKPEIPVLEGRMRYVIENSKDLEKPGRKLELLCRRNFVLNNRVCVAALRSFQKAMGTRLDMSMAYHLETDGQSERTIQLLKIIYHASIKAAPFESLYGQKCRLPVCWAEVGDAWLTSPELVHETTEKIVQIKQRMQAARDR
ncbi:putative reverse transcriptase domain-containing protein [Tanacetum coccineum]|uniref:Reverse transcriptase domain-containing protein n=1 Tax=Tanacetum coccineum TaxID=301880 RepID=A0ABQ5E8Z4_9ASTR